MIDKLNKICEVKENIDLKSYNTYKLDVKAKVMVFPNSTDDLIKILNIINEFKSKYFVIGNGSNIILPEFYDGVIIKLNKFNNYKINDDTVYAESGVMLNKLAFNTSNEGYRGLDFAVGVPGTIGGSIYGNAGCYGSSISEVLISANVLIDGKIVNLKNSDFNFGYRYSMLKENKDYIVLDALFKIEKCNKEELLEEINERINKRKSTQDLTHPSNGSMFRNPEGYSAGKLIDDLGLKGYRINDAMVSNIHANFIINSGNAKSEDIISLADFIKKRVKEEYNIDLVMEQEIIK